MIFRGGPGNPGRPMSRRRFTDSRLARVVFKEDKAMRGRTYEVPTVRYILEMARRGGLQESEHLRRQREEHARQRKEERAA